MNRRALAAPVILFALAGVAAVIAGPLNPPSGPVTSTYKTLHEVEPRTPISSVPFVINNPGSYYLTRNITAGNSQHGITINVSDVTIDLSGFTLTGGTGEFNGINVASPTTNLSVRNGTLRGWGGGGIAAAAAANSRFEKVTAVACGLAGLSIGSKCTIDSCSAFDGAGVGIQTGPYVTLTNCNAADNDNTGIAVASNAVVSNCQSSSNGAGHGFDVGGASLITACTATNNAGAGIRAGARTTISNSVTYGCGGGGIVVQANSTITGCTASNHFAGAGITVATGSTVTNCTASGNNGDGIMAASDCHITGNTCADNVAPNAVGIRVTGNANRIDSNAVSRNSIGIRAEVADNIVIRNTARANYSGNYSFPAGAESGQIISNPGNGFIATNPWANFAY